MKFKAETQRGSGAEKILDALAALRLGVKLLAAVLFFSITSFAQATNNVGPGVDAEWPDAGKEGVGTSMTLNSKVWFTLRHGMLTEVYYPTVDVANVQSLQFVVVNQKTRKVETESEYAAHRLEVLNGLTFRQTNTSPVVMLKV